MFSGGQDSTTCLAWALDRFAHIETVAFDYRQRHRVELECRKQVLAEFHHRFPAWWGQLGRHHLIDLGVLADLGDTALTRDQEIRLGDKGLPTTFVPGRNVLFLTVAGVIGYRSGARHIVAGMCETDFSGYPDCRDDAVKAVQLALNLGMAARFVVHTPLMWLDKAATWRLAEQLGGAALIELIREHTHTCYLGERSKRHDWGCGCGDCPACRLRAEGWARYRAGPRPEPCRSAGVGRVTVVAVVAGGRGPAGLILRALVGNQSIALAFQTALVQLVPQHDLIVGQPRRVRDTRQGDRTVARARPEWSDAGPCCRAPGRSREREKAALSAGDAARGRSTGIRRCRPRPSRVGIRPLPAHRCASGEQGDDGGRDNGLAVNRHVAETGPPGRRALLISRPTPLPMR